MSTCAHSSPVPVARPAHRAWGFFRVQCKNHVRYSIFALLYSSGYVFRVPKLLPVYIRPASCWRIITLAPPPADLSMFGMMTGPGLARKYFILLFRFGTTRIHMAATGRKLDELEHNYGPRVMELVPGSESKQCKKQAST